MGVPTRQPARAHRLPTIWLFTDERLGDGLWRAVHRLPAGSGIVFRHFDTPPEQRRAIFQRLLRIARQRGLLVIRAGAQPLAGEQGAHGTRNGRPGQPTTWPAHNRAEAVAGLRAGADMLFVSPVYPTRSHPGAPFLGPRRAAAVARGLARPIVALGGMDARAFAQLAARGFHGWAAIDAWQRRDTLQKRKAVPI